MNEKNHEDGRIVKLETQLSDFVGEFRLFRTNEFVHLRAKVDRLYWLILTTLVGVIGILLKLFIK